MEKITNLKFIIKSGKSEEKQNPKKAQITKDKLEYSKLSNDKNKIDFLAKKLGFCK